MSKKKFRILFNGEIRAGYKQHDVQSNLAKLFKVSEEKIHPLFTGKSIILKKDLSHAYALKYAQALEAAGAIVILKHQQEKNTPKQSTAQVKRVPIEKILASFTKTVEPVKVKFRYKLNITLSALLIFMLPVTYIGLISLVIYGVQFHAIENITLFSISSKVIALAFYLIPILAGSILVLFMVKPLFMNYGKQPASLELDPIRYPAMYEYVKKICDCVNAPYPSRINVDCNVNASASFKNGFKGMLSNELVLTIGLPLISGLNLRTLTGILAHEFGHFSQGAAMRMTYVIYTVLHWLRVAVHHRDAMDKKLEEWGNSNRYYVAIIPLISRLFIWFTRIILTYMLKIGDYINYAMSRQMEFDADRYETRMTGTEHFVYTSIQITRLSIASDNVCNEQDDAWYQNQQLVDDLTAAVISEYKNQPDDMDKKVLEYINEGHTRWQDTHPCDKERIENASLDDEEGIFHLNTPAADLITKIEKFSTQLTLLHYRKIWKLPVLKSQLIPVKKFENNIKIKQESNQAIEQYFDNSFSIYAPVTLKYPNRVNKNNLPAIKEQWLKYYNKQKNIVNISNVNEQANKLREKYIQAERAQAVISADIAISLSDFGLYCSSIDKVPSTVEQYKQDYGHIQNKINDYCQIAFKRMQATLDLSILQIDNADILDAICSQKQLTNIIQFLTRINAVQIEKENLYFDREKLSILLYAIEGETEKEIPNLTRVIEKLATICSRHISAIENHLTKLDYPFEHAKDNYQLNEHIFGYDVNNMSARDISSYAEHVLGNLHTMQWRAMSLLCKYIKQVEQIYFIDGK